MYKYYIGMAIIGTVFLAVIVGIFVESGSPLKAKDQKYDQERSRDLSSLSSSIKSYHRTSGTLPISLSVVNSLSKQDPETEQNYEYKKISEISYSLCAAFSTDTTNNQSRGGYVSNSSIANPSIHKEGKQCFNYTVSSTSSQTLKTTIVEDEKISKVTSDASNIRLSNFPYGFFSKNDSEYGLINYANEAVTVTIKFKNPTKIKSLSNTFTHCGINECYIWNAEGILKNGRSIKLATNVKTISNTVSKIEIESSKQFSKVNITAVRNKGTDNYVHWQKIKFEYK